MNKVLVIGGGAAGMMAAIFAAKQGADVTLLEQNEKLGKKLFLTGKGRCNVTNAAEIEDFFDATIQNPKFLRSAFYGFSNTDLIALLEDAGLATKIERGGRVFPASDHSSDVIKTLEKLLRSERVKIFFHTKAEAILQEEGNVVGVLANGKKINADAVVLATGGASYPLTGSRGDGYRFAKAMGHTIHEPKPSLIPLEVAEKEILKEAQGVSLKNVELSLYHGEKPVYSERGEMLITHFGVSGPLVLTASAYMQSEEDKNYRLLLDFKPALDEKQLDARLLREFEEAKNKALKNVLQTLLPKSMIAPFCAISGLDGEKKINAITKKEREKILLAMKKFPLKVTAKRSINEAIITRGGVEVREVSPSTMESKKVRGLFFAGELLDVDAKTGGYNLQIAFSTGALAGKKAAGIL